MRRFILTAAVIVAGLAAGSARAIEPVNVTIESVGSTTTTRGVNISSAPTFSIIISTVFLYRQACVQNFDTSNFLACSENVNVSTITTDNTIGTIIPAAGSATTPANPTCFSVVAGNHYYCRTSSVSGTSRAGITRGR